MTPNAILGIDPGVTTGLAYYRDGRVTAWQMTDPELALTAITGFIEAYDNPHQQLLVVFERFVIGTNTSRHTAEARKILEWIGKLEDVCRRKAVMYMRQNPADAKKMSSNHELRRLGMYTPLLPHANDAVRHVLLGMLRTWPEELERIRKKEADAVHQPRR